jgi:hypothetical protein
LLSLVHCLLRYIQLYKRVFLKEEKKKLTTIKCSICGEEYEEGDFKENHLSTQHGITGPIAEYLAHLEQRIKALEDNFSASKAHGTY